jgi:hypothetical protein
MSPARALGCHDILSAGSEYARYESMHKDRPQVDPGAVAKSGAMSRAGVATAGSGLIEAQTMMLIKLQDHASSTYRSTHCLAAS